MVSLLISITVKYRLCVGDFSQVLCSNYAWEADVTSRQWKTFSHSLTRCIGRSTDVYRYCTFSPFFAQSFSATTVYDHRLSIFVSVCLLSGNLCVACSREPVTECRSPKAYCLPQLGCLDLGFESQTLCGCMSAFNFQFNLPFCVPCTILQFVNVCTVHHIAMC